MSMKCSTERCEGSSRRWTLVVTEPTSRARIQRSMTFLRSSATTRSISARPSKSRCPTSGIVSGIGTIRPLSESAHTRASRCSRSSASTASSIVSSRGFVGSAHRCLLPAAIAVRPAAPSMSRGKQLVHRAGRAITHEWHMARTPSTHSSAAASARVSADAESQRVRRGPRAALRAPRPALPRLRGRRSRSRTRPRRWGCSP